MEFQVTIRYGSGRQRYHLIRVTGENVREVLAALPDKIPDEVVDSADLVEVRPSVDPEGRSYLGDGEA